MTLLTFNVMEDKLLNREKQQTIRANIVYWSKRLDKNNKLDIWWLNPRNRHKRCRKLGIGNGTYELKYGRNLTQSDAWKDGLSDRIQLQSTLMKIYKLSPQETLDKRWIIISWEWVDKYV